MTNDLAGSEAATIVSLVTDEAVDWEVLEARHLRSLQLVSKVLGVVPNCDRYLEIWPPAFRTYNVMVPNLLNLPVPVMGVGGPPPGVVGLAMYVASRTAECPYCTAHSCTFAMRRGASPEQVAAALVPERGSFDDGELAAIAVAKALARVPCELTAAEKDALIGVYGHRRAEWIALAVVMMGFLDKFMDGLGVELEQDVFDEVADTMGAEWSPGAAGGDLDGGSMGVDDAALVLARAVSPTPAQVDATTVGDCRQAGISAPAIIELVSWLALLQLLHRLGCWIDPPTDDGGDGGEPR